MRSGVVDEPVCKDIAVEDGRLLALLVEIEEEAVSVVWGSAVCGIHGCLGAKGREGGETEAGEWTEDGSN